MNDVLTGCRIQSGPTKKYWKNLGALEVESRVVETIRPATARRWRSEAPEGARFVPVAPSAVAAFDAAGRAAWDRTLAVAGLFESDTVLLRTPASFRPTSANRERLKAFVSEGRPDGLHIAWWADGLWDSQPDDRDALCAAAGLVPVIDPLSIDDDDDEPPAGDRIYWRLLGRKGLASRYGDFELDSLLDLVSERQTGYVFFAAPTMLADARRFASMVQMNAA